MANILAIIAHPDDEMNCAGLMTKNSKEGGENFIVCFVDNEGRKEELKKSCKILNAEFTTLGFNQLEITPSHALRKKLKNLIVSFKPDIVVIQSKDYHPDHQIIHDFALHVMEFASHGDENTAWLTPVILELEASALIDYPDVIYDITNEQEARKEVMKVHQSQVKRKSFGKYYLDIVEQKARLRGAQIGTEYGEAYRLHHLSIKGNFYPTSRGYRNVGDIFSRK